jgi:hypothetical protein
MATTLTLHINDKIPNDIMKLFFSNVLGHRLCVSFELGHMLPDKEKAWKPFREKYNLVDSDIYFYFDRLPHFEIGTAYVRYDDSGERDFEKILDLVERFDLDGYGAPITETFIAKMKMAAGVYLSLERTDEFIEWLQMYKGMKVFRVNW